MSLVGYSLMTVLHELVFNFENRCNLYNIVENYDINYKKKFCIGLHHSLQQNQYN